MQPYLCSLPSLQLFMHVNGQANAYFPKYIQFILGNVNIYCGGKSDDDTCSGSKRDHVRKTVLLLSNQQPLTFNLLGDHPPGSRKSMLTLLLSYSPDCYNNKHGRGHSIIFPTGNLYFQRFFL